MVGNSDSNSGKSTKQGREFILRGQDVYDAKTNNLEGWIREDLGGSGEGSRKGMSPDPSTKEHSNR